MRWISLILFCTTLSTICADPDPKKYKSEVKEKNKVTNASLTEDERKFLREVEAKFGIKADLPVDIDKNINDDKTNGTEPPKAPFPAVIAIEIVNDTDTNTKGKRTIDANLGYGYRTNNGYTYTYYGKQPQEKGKFMIYPYSQEDIPPSPSTSYNSNSYHGSSNAYTTVSTNVEIQPSRAYELVDVKQEQNSYQYQKPSPDYHDIKGLVSPPPQYNSGSHQEMSHQTYPSTLYTTYNGHDFSSLSGQFPMVMSNYLVDPTQLIKNPQYQNAGISQDYIRSHGSPLDQRVVPVLVLRIPSSFLKKPTAELYSNSPHNYPVSHYLNKVNLQEIVNSYFKKLGYDFAPQVMHYQNSAITEPVPTAAVEPMAHYEHQHYASSHVQQPSYTQADYSGIQYSGVQPVMAKYPSTYSHQQYYVQPQSLYQQPEQQYEYQYQYVPQSEQTQSHYVQPQYQTEEVTSQDSHSGHVAASPSAVLSQHDYKVQSIQETSTPSADYGVPESQSRHLSSVSHLETSQEYGAPKEQTVDYTPHHTISTEYGPAKVQLPTYSNEESAQSQYGSLQQDVPKQTIAYYTSQHSASVDKYSPSVESQSYYYQKPVNDDSASQQLVLSENYPSKDHTLATVLPSNYKRDKKPNSVSVQTVSYVTPVPYSSKYPMPYKIMVPQTVLRNPGSEKVSYVNSHSLSSQLANEEYNPEAEYTVSTHYVPPISKQKPPAYPRNYHSHPKRNTKPDNKSVSKPVNTNPLRKHKEKADYKKSS